ncbi:hypothetical protein BU17DRAFT_104071 [Hysterangium stoloniferum]|nr:hypothetical protein BU17DRAFT_104071 [Hysterangium stoloniferum]
MTRTFSSAIRSLPEFVRSVVMSFVLNFVLIPDKATPFPRPCALQFEITVAYEPASGTSTMDSPQDLTATSNQADRHYHHFSPLGVQNGLLEEFLLRLVHVLLGHLRTFSYRRMLQEYDTPPFHGPFKVLSGTKSKTKKFQGATSVQNRLTQVPLLASTVKSLGVSEYQVASGGYSDVWTGLWGQKKVAIKVARGFSSHGRRIEKSELLKRIGTEYLIWSNLRHENVLECLGFSYDFGGPAKHFQDILVA